jgi:hypothetical protein
MDNQAFLRIPDAGALMVAALLLFALRWAAIARARAHGEWAKRRRDSRNDAPAIDWYVATWAIAGWL